jgi:hypothetical protein
MYDDPSWYSWQAHRGARYEFSPMTTRSTAPVPGIVVHSPGQTGLFIANEHCEAFVAAFRAAVAESRLRGIAGRAWMGHPAEDAA